MVLHLFGWLVELAAEAQRARDTLFPETAGSPVIFIIFLSATASVLSVLDYPHCPLRDHLPLVSELFRLLAERLPELYGSNCLGFTLDPLVPAPAAAEIQRDVEALRSEMATCLEVMVPWFLAMDLPKLKLFQMRLWCAMCTLDELEYYESMGPIRMIQCGFGSLHAALERSLLEIRPTTPADSNELDSSQ